MGRPGPLERGRGYLRARPALAEPVSFCLDGYDFETDGKDLWVIPPGSARIDRIKVSRYLADQSIRKGYPRELIRPDLMTEDWARAAALFWLKWSRTDEAAQYPFVHLDHYVRQMEQRHLASA